MSIDLFTPDDRDVLAAHIGELTLDDAMLERFFSSAIEQAIEKHEKALHAYGEALKAKRAKDQPEPVAPQTPTPQDAVDDMMANLRAALKAHTGNDGRKPPRDELQEQIDFIRWVMDSDAPAPADPHNFPANLSDKLSDWDTGADENNLTTEDLSEDLAQLVTGKETLAQAVERMTPGLDELLDMAQALSNASLEKAVATIEPERANDWMERLFSERGRLRLARGTVDENLSRENLINKTVGVFGRVGAKR